MKTKEQMKALSQKTLAELDTDLKDKKSELFNLRFQLATGQLQNTAALKQCKKDIARVKHPLYGKIMNRTTRLKAHDEENACGVGDRVMVMETRPLSKDKRWRLTQIIEKAK